MTTNRARLNRPILVIGIVSLAYLLVTVSKTVTWPPELSHLATTLVAVLIVHILDHTYFRGEVRAEFDDLSAKIVADVKRQTGQELEHLKGSVEASVGHSRLKLEQSLNALLADQSGSASAMQKNAIRRIYASRGEAAPRIADSLAEPSRFVRLMGVSLNDFFRGDNQQLRDAWLHLSSTIQAAPEGEVEREIRILMINPRSFGAVLRSYAEASQTGPVFVGRLKSDVEAALDNLLQLEQLSTERTVRVSCRLYNVSPSMFICHLDERSFVQHYHFWTQRRDATPMAVTEFHKSDDPHVFPMHSEIKSHFDVIWEHASIPVAEYWTEHATGIDEPAGQSGLRNIYNVREEGSSRIDAVMLALQGRTRSGTHREHSLGVSIQGVSLKSFFSRGTLSNRMYELIQAGQTPVRILFLDRDCEQATIRSYREHLLHPQGSQIDYQTFADKLHERSALYTNTGDAIDQLKQWIEEFSRIDGWQCKVEARAYRSAPMSFLLQVGARLFSEPYNYGKLGGQSNIPVTLGTDMPLFEFQRQVPDLFNNVEYRKNNLDLRNPFLLLMDHFDFAFRTATEIKLSDRRDLRGTT